MKPSRPKQRRLSAAMTAKCAAQISQQRQFPLRTLIELSLLLR